MTIEDLVLAIRLIDNDGGLIWDIREGQQRTEDEDVTEADVKRILPMVCELLRKKIQKRQAVLQEEYER